MSTLKVNQIRNNSGGTAIDVPGAAKAWANWQGTATGTITPRSSLNIASITKNGTGDYTLAFATALPAVDYMVSGYIEESTAARNDFTGIAIWRGWGTNRSLNTTTTARIYTGYKDTSSGGREDQLTVAVAFFSN